MCGRLCCHLPRHIAPWSRRWSSFLVPGCPCTAGHASLADTKGKPQVNFELSYSWDLLRASPHVFCSLRWINLLQLAIPIACNVAASQGGPPWLLAKGKRNPYWLVTWVLLGVVTPVCDWDLYKCHKHIGVFATQNKTRASTPIVGEIARGQKWRQAQQFYSHKSRSGIILVGGLC